MPEPSPIHLAHLLADLAWQDYAKQAREKAEWIDDEAILPASYLEFDADSGTHLVQTTGVEPALRAETNGGLRRGDSVEFIDGVIDAMPYPATRDPRRTPKVGVMPKFAALVQKRALVRIRTIYDGGSSAIVTPESQATIGVVYYNANSPPHPDWVGVEAEPRYTFGIERWWSGSPPTANRLYNRNRERFCWDYQEAWQQAPRNIVRPSGYNYERQFPQNKLCYEWLIRSRFNPSGYDAGGGLILIHLQPLRDPAPNVPLPRIFHKTRNPDFPHDVLASGVTSVLETAGERWLGCDFSGGIAPDIPVPGGDALTAHLGYNWQPLEIFPFSDYVPPTVIEEERPPRIIQIPEYEMQYWIFTDSDPPKKLDFVTATQSTAFISLPEGSLIYDNSSIAIDNTGNIHTAIRAEAGAAEVIRYWINETDQEEPTSWRSGFTDDFERDESIPNSCHRDYQNYETINLNEAGDRLFQISKELTIDDILDGVEFDIWAYDIETNTSAPTPQNETVCGVELNRAPDITEPATLPEVQPENFSLTKSAVHEETARLLTYAAHILE